MFDKRKLKHLLQFKSRSKLRAIISNTAWLFGDRILRMVGGLLVGIWFARYLGSQQFGLFNYALAFVTLLTPIFTLGLDNVVVRYLVKEDSSKDEILGTTFGLKLVGGIVSVLLAVIIIFFLEGETTLTVWLVAILSITGIFRATDTIDLWFQSQVQSKYSVIAKNVAYLLTTILKVVLIINQASLLAFAWVTLAEVVIAAICLVAIYQTQEVVRFFDWKWSLPTAKYLMRESFPLILSGFAILLYMKVDQIMLGQMKSDSEVGVYSAAVRISELWYFIPNTIVLSVTPAIYAAKEKSEQYYYKRLTQLLRLLNYISLVISIPMTFLSKDIVLIMFGNEYAAAGSILAVHIWASVFVSMGLATSPWFIAEGLNHVSLGKTVFGAILNIVLNFLLIPQYGGIGAAFATISSQAASTFFCNAFDRRTRKLFKIQARSLLPF